LGTTPVMKLEVAESPFFENYVAKAKSAGRIVYE
jgi:hypothetical protein